MVNYENGKIYKIEPICDHDEQDIYIGSTTKKYLSDRMCEHRADYKRYSNTQKKTTSFILFDKYGVKNCKIILLENYACTSKNELVAQEAEHIKNMACVNKVIPQRTKQEYDKMYNEKNKEKKQEYERSEMRKEQRKIFDQSEKRKEWHKQWRQEIITCECGCQIKRGEYSRHKKSQKHQQNINIIM